MGRWEEERQVGVWNVEAGMRVGTGEDGEIGKQSWFSKQSPDWAMDSRGCRQCWALWGLIHLREAQDWCKWRPRRLHPLSTPVCSFHTSQYVALVRNVLALVNRNNLLSQQIRFRSYYYWSLLLMLLHAFLPRIPVICFVTRKRPQRHHSFQLFEDAWCHPVRLSCTLARHCWSTRNFILLVAALKTSLYLCFLSKIISQKLTWYDSIDIMLLASYENNQVWLRRMTQFHKWVVPK